MSEMINPYIAGAPVTETRMFFGREDVFDWIQNSLSGRYADHILVIHGQRRVGKTSVLKQLGNRLPDKYIPVFFDLQGRTHTTLDRFLWWLAREIVRVLKQERDITVPVPEKEPFAADFEYFETRFLPSLQPHIGDRSLLLTFDEFDNLEESDIKEELSRPLIDYLRRLMGEEGISFIFSIGSSGRKLENMQASYTEFFKTALYKKISFLSSEQTAGLVTRPVEGLLEYEHDAVERIFEITSGHPYFTQLTCHELFSLCQRTGELRIREKDVEAILEDVVERGTVNLKFTWDEATDLEKWNLTTLAHHDEPLNNHALGDFLRTQRVRFSDSDLTSSMLHLRERDILTEDNRFVIYLLKLWLKKNRTIEQVREELTEVNPIANRFIEIGLEFQDSGLYDKAIENFKEALAVSPDNIQAQVNIAQAYMAQKDLSQAVAEFEKALAMDDEDVASRSGFCEAHLALGDATNEKGKTREAIQSYQKVLSINTEHTEARQRMAEISRGRAEKALADGRDEEALAAFAEALKFTPEDENLSARYEQAKFDKRTKVLASLLAKADKEQGSRNWEAALKILENALEIAPGDEKVQQRLGIVKSEQRKEQLQAILARADRAAGAGRWGLVIAALEEYLTLEPEDAKVQSRIEEARQKLTEAQVEEARSRARGLSRQERFEEAITAWNEYQKINPSDNQTVQAEIEKVHKAQTLAQNYMEAQKAFSKKNYEKAVSLLRGIVVENADYKDATRLMAEAIELRRTARKWWQSKWLWGGVVGSVVLIVGWFAFRPGSPLLTPPASPPLEVTATAGALIAPPISTNTPGPTSTPSPTPTPLPFTWSRLNSGQFLSRGSISSVVFDPTDPGVMYAGTGGAGIYKSLDGGLSWQPVLNGLGRSAVSSLVIDPQEPDTLYAGVLLGGVYKTTDGARTWQPINEGIDVPGGAFLATVVMDPTDHNHLYYTDSLGLYETTDGGENWTKLQMPTCPKMITSLVMPPGTSNTIYIADREKSAECSLGIYRSRDGGKTWDSIPIGISQYLQLHYWSLAVASEPQERIYVSGSIAGDDKFYRTMDEGQTWESIREHRCFATEIDPNQNGRIFCGGPDQLLASQDWGDSWTPVLNEKLIWEVTLSPHAENTLVAGGDGSGLFISNDGGTKWSENISGLGGTYLSLSISPFDNVTMFAEGGYSIFRSTNDGQAWNFLTDQGSGLAFDADQKTMYVLADAILKSEDDGKTWERMARTNQSISSFVTQPQQSNTIIAIHDSGFSVSSEGGQSWNERNNIAWKGETEQIVGTIFTSLLPDKAGEQFYILISSETTSKILRLDGITGAWGVCQLPANVTTVNLLAIDPRDSNRTIISSPGNGLLTSSDGCQSWQESNTGLASLFVNTLIIDSNNPDTIYAGTDGGAYISFDGGQTWGQVNDGLLGATVVYSIAVDKDSNVYAATPYGIFKLERK